MFHSLGKQVSDKLPWNSPQRNSLLQRSHCPLRDGSLPHLPKTFPETLMCVEICICLLSGFSHTKLQEAAAPRAQDGSNSMKPQALGRKAAQPRFCQHWKAW